MTQPARLPRLGPRLTLHLAWATVGRDWLCPVVWPLIQALDWTTLVIWRIRVRAVSTRAPE